ncbi:MAG: hypothetical protein QXU32_06570 [Nitrososphaerales archaeon]
MLSQAEQEMVKKIRKRLGEIEGTIKLYSEELREGRFRPRRGERWERTIEKHMVTAAMLLGKSEEEILQEF